MENKKKKKKKIDIILPNYNSHEYITETIKSIINQSYTHWELTIVDDSSDKKTRDILKQSIAIPMWLKKTKEDYRKLGIEIKLACNTRY